MLTSPVVREEAAVSMQVMAHWLCNACDVEGRDPDAEPSCWNCGGAVIVTARPTVKRDITSEAA